MDRQRYMAELSKLLTFMFKEDRAEILQHYNELLDNAEDEQALLDEFGSPTKLAVTISRTYSREERKLSVNIDSKEEVVPVEYVKPDESQFKPITPIQSEKQTHVEEPADSDVDIAPEYTGSYAEIIEEIRRELAEERGEEYVPIFFDEETETPTSESEPELELVSETVETTETVTITVELDEADGKENDTKPAEDVELVPASEETSDAEEEAEAPAEVEELIEQPEDELDSEEDENASEEDIPEAEEAPEEEPERETAEKTEAEEALEPEGEPEAEEELDIEEEKTVIESDPEETEFVAVPLEAEAPIEEKSEVPEKEVPNYSTDFLDEAEEEKKAAQKLSPGLLILYLIPAVPVGIVLLLLTAAVTLVVLSAAAATMAFGVMLTSFALSGIAVTADLMLIVGAALIAFGLGILLLWTGLWLIIAGFKAIINGIVKLGRKICVKGAE